MKFYIRDIRTNPDGHVLWWAPDGNGYTCDLDAAGLYSEEEAKAIERGRKTDVAVPEEDARAAGRRRFLVEPFRVPNTQLFDAAGDASLCPVEGAPHVPIEAIERLIAATRRDMLEQFAKWVVRTFGAMDAHDVREYFGAPSPEPQKVRPERCEHRAAGVCWQCRNQRREMTTEALDAAQAQVPCDECGQPTLPTPPEAYGPGARNICDDCCSRFDREVAQAQRRCLRCRGGGDLCPHGLCMSCTAIDPCRDPAPQSERGNKP